MDIQKTEEGLLKLRYKDLQKIARQWNINAKSRKVDIVKALMSSDCTAVDIESCILEQKENNTSEANENSPRRTITRSKICIELDKEDKHGEPIVLLNDDKKTENVPQRKKRKGKQILEDEISTKSPSVSKTVSAPEPVKTSEAIIKSQPLLEISNSIPTQVSDINPKSSTPNTEKTSKSRKIGKGTTRKKGLSQEALESEHECEHVLNECIIGKISSEHEVNNAVDMKSYAKKGRKRRRSNENLESATKHLVGEMDRQAVQEEEINPKPMKKRRQKQLKQETSSSNYEAIDNESEARKTIQYNDIISDVQNCNGDNSESVPLEAIKNKRRTHSITKEDDAPNNTYTISNVSEEADTKNTVEDSMMPVFVPAPLIRSSTFTLDNDDKDKKTVSESTKSNGKSIGKRIMAASIKRGAVITSNKKSNSNNSLSVKKTISKNSVTKNIGTPGSTYRNKFGVARKAPNFKHIHQKMFDSMESIDANQKRNLERGQKLIMSPAPRCAFTRKSFDNSITDKVNSPQPRKSISLPENKPVFTVGSTHKPLRSSVSKPVVNRFGFKKRSDTIEKTVGQKLPPVNIEKKKEEKRNVIHGVRMNKRFMLQMQMRKNTN